MSDNDLVVVKEGFEQVSQGVVINVSFEQLEKELYNQGHVKEGEVITQYNINEKGVGFVISKL
jgi:hypothetical protein